MLQIILNGKYDLDINDDINLLMTYQVGDVRNFLGSNANYTKTVSIAGTNNNNIAFGCLFDITNYSNYNPNKKADVVVLNDGVEIFKGYLKVDSIKIDFEKKISYECTLYGQIADMFTELNNLKLNQLDFSQYTHPYVWDSVSGSWNTFIYVNGNKQPFELGQGYVYPYIDYGTDQDEDDINKYVSFFKPALYAKTVLDAVFVEAGYSYKSDFINSNYFKSLIVVPDAGSFAIDSITANNVKAQASVQEEYIILSAITFDTNFQTFGFRTDYLTAPFDDNYTPPNFDNGHNFNISTYEYVVPTTGNYQIDANVQFDVKYTDLNVALGAPVVVNCGIEYVTRISFIRNGTKYPITDSAANATLGNVGQDYVTGQNIGGSFPNYPSIHNGDTLNSGYTQYTGNPFIGAELATSGLFLAGDKILVESLIQLGPRSSNYNNQFQIRFDFLQMNPSFINIQLLNNKIAEGSTYNFHLTLSEDQCSDFITSLGAMFNWYFEFDKDDSTCVHIEPRQNFYNGDVIDWTYKLDRDNETESFTMAEITAADFLFTYRSDSDYYNTDYQNRNIANIFGSETINIYGDYLYQINNDFVPKNQIDKVELIFSPTPLTNEFVYNNITNYDAYNPNVASGASYQTGKIISTIFDWSTKTNPPAPLNKSNLRILYYGGLISCPTWLGVDSTVYVNPYQILGGGNTNVATYRILESYPYAGYLDNPYNPTQDLNFWFPDYYYYNRNTLTTSNLFNNFWATDIADITDKESQLFTGFFNLNTADIASLSFRNIIYLDSTYWIINQISDYNPVSENLTKVELLKLVNYSTTSQNLNVKQQLTNLNVGQIKDLPYSGSNNQQVIIGEVINAGKLPFTQTNLVVGANNTGANGSVQNVIAGNNNRLATNTVNVISAGDNNAFNQNTKSLNIGDNNSLTAQSRTILNLGNNNSLSSYTYNSLIVGDNISSPVSNSVNSNNLNLISDSTINNSGKIFYNGQSTIILNSNGITVNGNLTQGINLISAGRNVVADEFPSYTPVSFISAGRDGIRGFGSYTVVNFISAGRDTVAS